jgi:hypothetical protein
MVSVGLITKILKVHDGDKPQMGPTHTTPIKIEALSHGTSVFLEMSQEAALEIVQRLSGHLKERGCL